MKLPEWFRLIVFGRKPRSPRRLPCVCGHPWAHHNRFGCKSCRAARSGGQVACPRNRAGRLPKQPSLSEVKEGA